MGSGFGLIGEESLATSANLLPSPGRDRRIFERGKKSQGEKKLAVVKEKSETPGRQ